MLTYFTAIFPKHYTWGTIKQTKNMFMHFNTIVRQQDQPDSVLLLSKCLRPVTLWVTSCDPPKTLLFTNHLLPELQL